MERGGVSRRCRLASERSERPAGCVGIAHVRLPPRAPTKQRVSSERRGNQRRVGQQTLGPPDRVDWVTVSTHASPSLGPLRCEKQTITAFGAGRPQEKRTLKSKIHVFVCSACSRRSTWIVLVLSHFLEMSAAVMRAFFQI